MSRRWHLTALKIRGTQGLSEMLFPSSTPSTSHLDSIPFHVAPSIHNGPPTFTPLRLPDFNTASSSRRLLAEYQQLQAHALRACPHWNHHLLLATGIILWPSLARVVVLGPGWMTALDHILLTVLASICYISTIGSSAKETAMASVLGFYSLDVCRLAGRSSTS